MRVHNMRSQHYNLVPNQFVIQCDNGDEVFQSYSTVIAKRSQGKVILDSMWDYSKTTGKYRNKFLGESKAETERKIKSGEYKVENLNG